MIFGLILSIIILYLSKYFWDPTYILELEKNKECMFIDIWFGCNNTKDLIFSI
jgi:hypothetical protein